MYLEQHKIAPETLIEKTDDSLTLEFTVTEEDIEDNLTPVVQRENGTFSVFNLAGQRLSKPQKGINIARGQKVLKAE